MLLNYLKTAIRNLLGNKAFSFINIFGLALGMSVCMMVIIWVKDLYKYERFHPHAGRIYRVITELTDREGNEFRFATTATPLAAAFVKDFNLVDRTVRIFSPGNADAASPTKQLTIKKVFTDSSFFQVFGFGLKHGDRNSCLELPNSVVITSGLAQRFFGYTDVTGQVLDINDWGSFRITGVVDSAEYKSHLDFEAFISMGSVPYLVKSGKLTTPFDSWENARGDGYTYLKVKKDVSQSQLDKALRILGDDITKHSKTVGREKISFESQRITSIAMGEDIQSSLGSTSSRGKVMAAVGIALLILISACFNYTNLTIARSLTRSREIGIRKVAGAFRKDIFIQFMTESLIFSTLSLIVAFLLLKLITSQTSLAGGLIPDNYSFEYDIFGWFAVFMIFTSLLAGILPAWTLSSFKPVWVLKNLSTLKVFGSDNFRKGLIVVQFSLSMVITFCNLTFSRQFKYMYEADPGFARENILSIPLHDIDRKVLSTEISKLSSVQHVSASSDNLGRNFTGVARLKTSADAAYTEAVFYDVDTGFISSMGLTLIAGKNFPADISGRHEPFVIINEKAASALGFGDAAKATGQPIIIDDSVQTRIAGVVRDFHFRGLTFAIVPLVLRSRAENFNYLNVRVTHSDKKIVSEIESVYRRLAPKQEFSCLWLQDEHKAHSGDDGFGMLDFLSAISLVLACMGLLGIVMYSVETRKKEIGVRKILGADVSAIVYLLSRNFVKLVLIAGCIALPIACVLSFMFLSIFANRVSIGVEFMLLGFSGVVLITLITIFSQIYRVASSNPVGSLRSE